MTYTIKLYVAVIPQVKIRVPEPKSLPRTRILAKSRRSVTWSAVHDAPILVDIGIR